MDIFRILTRGASIRKDKQPSGGYAKPKVNEKQKAESLQHQVEKEVDFFHTKSHKVELKELEEPEVITEGSEEKPVVQAPQKIKNAEDALALRTANSSKVTGEDIPLPIGSFHDLTGRFNLDPKLLSNLIENEFVEPTPIQCESIPITLHDRDLISCAPTGSGKTLAFLIPLIQQILESKGSDDTKNHGIRGLIISPTNELTIQIFQQLQNLTKGKKLTVGILLKQLASKLSNKIVTASKFDILVSTPLRLIELVKNETVDLSKVEQLIIDEADKLFDKGFVEQTDDILSNCTLSTIRKSMFSATIPSGVEEMAHSIMKDPIRIIIGHKEAASNTIDQKLVYTGNEEGKLLAIRQMIQQSEFKPPVIIFLQSIHRAKALFHELIYDKLNVDVIHAERTPKQREEVIKRFKNGDIWVLITTDVISRGVDFKGVNLVINYDVPQSAQAYVHRIGRTGRGGREGNAVTFFTKEDDKLVKPIINVMKQSGCKDGYSGWMENLGKLTKNEKKEAKRGQLKRKQISTVPKVIKDKKRKKERMIEDSKRKFHGEQA
ncbi:ATP-dependent RNA helicase ROK1 [Suhomyces tanzawaensis NRRL Y-17324]|uniref:RNA helicase n=1 Tax=Suhomyces tanzawaensis NRRL Y-17324 TaxID=984487 RepID=A0A1E4SEQ4_9ASCO|nr:ATP-dependent RNA helicase ROK1 [Suhomyces tanzawaensis NRRL Y-17324]ODV78004.1 ATP-dependent RNA helicase ROK1 [Suhomyces tanzawaensis NRRL Y-17324]